MRSYQQCVFCVMDTTDPYIHFDSNGRCNHCIKFTAQIQHFKETNRWSEKHLAQIVKRIKQDGHNKKYDCILGVSGGVDSSYVAYQLKQLGLRTLLVHMDNGWDSQPSVANIRNIAHGLEFDYESYVLDWEEFKRLQLAFLRADVIEAETPTDIAIAGCLHRVAAKHRVKYIISGGNIFTEGILPGYWHYNSRDKRYLNDINRKFGNDNLKRFPHFGIFEETYYKFFRKIKMVYIINFFDYDRTTAMQLLEQKLGWQQYGGKHHESLYTKFVQSYLLPVKFAIDYRRATYSSMICSGIMDRETALKNLQSLPYDANNIGAVLKYIALKLGITTDELEKIIARPGKKFNSYKNTDVLLNTIYKIYRKIN